MRERTLDRLFRRFRDRGDGRALAAVFDGTARELLDVACHLHRDPVEAEDLVQATFLAALRGAKRYDGSSPVRAWLYGILWREAAKARRRGARAVDPDRLPERRQPEPFEGLVAGELPRAVDRALEGLSPRYREVLAPLLQEGRAAEDIARDLGRSPGTVRSQIHRGLEHLRRSLPKGFVPASGLTFLPVRGLDGLRAEVLRVAGFSPSIAAAAPVLALQTALGAFLMSKVTLSAAAAALIAGTLVLLNRDPVRLDAVGPADPGPAVAEPEGPSALQRQVEPAAGRAPSGLPEPGGGDEVAPVPTPGVQDELAHWRARFNERPEDWRHGLAVARELAQLAPDQALRVVEGLWDELSLRVKEQVLKPFVFRPHPHALKMLHLAATDEALSVQSRAFQYLKDYAFRDFANDYQGYLAWAARYRDLPPGQVVSENADGLIAELLQLSPAELTQRVRELGDLDFRVGEAAGVDLAERMRAAGGLQVLSSLLELDNVDARRQALAWSATLEADEPWLRTWVLPAVLNDGETDPALLGSYFGALGREDCPWAQEPILAYLDRQAATLVDPEAAASPALSFNAAQALAAIGDPAAIPRLIQVLQQDGSGRLNYAVGYFGLAQLTGVTWQESYDAGWWLDWWDKNAARLPAEVRAIGIER